MSASQLQKPPRRVPLFLGLQCLFGGFLQQFGWAFYTFGMLFVLIFGSQADLPRLLAFRGAVERVPGVVLRAEETNAEVNETEVVAYVFRYQVDGTTYEGRSYSTGFRLEPEDTVGVEYSLAHPEMARIEGTRSGTFGPWILLLILPFPSAGLAMAWFGFRDGFRGRTLLSRGQLAFGKLSNKEATGVEINDETVYALTFVFEPEYPQRDYTVTAKTHRPETLEDEEREPILYDPRDPNQAVLLDNLPGQASVTSAGNLSSGSLFSALAVLLLPLASLGMTIVTIFALLP